MLYIPPPESFLSEGAGHIKNLSASHSFKWWLRQQLVVKYTYTFNNDENKVHYLIIIAG